MMLFSEREGFIFIHNPKCAGTSVRNALMSLETTGNFFWMVDQWNGRKIDKAHIPLNVMRNKYPEYFALLKTHTVFTFVRNPYDRTVSAFGESHKDLVAAIGTDGGLERYTDALNALIGRLRPADVRGLDFEFRHFVAQSAMIYLGGKRYVDVVMKMEDWPGCLDQVGVLLPRVARLLRESKSRNRKSTPRPAVSYLTDASIKQINNLYADDFRLFGYDMLESQAQ